MFKKILIANRGDQPRSGAAPALQANCQVCEAGQGGFTAEVTHV